MKKMYFFALAAAGLLTACSSDDAASNGGGSNPTDETALVPIQIGVSPASVTTRGTGTVGGTTEADNKWNNEIVNIYMFEKGTMELAKFEFDQATTEGGSTSHTIYENKAFTAPASTTNEENSSTTNTVTLKDNSNDIEYYPMQGNFDFWGYRIDDAKKISDNTDTQNDSSSPTPEAVTSEGSTVTDGNTAAAYVVKFKIDGSQDVMRGKAALSKSDSTNLGEVNHGRAYSAFAARKGVQPNIAFQHMLTRLTFTVTPGSESAAGINDDLQSMGYEAVQVEKITVKSKYKATLPVAWTEAYKDKSGMTFEETTTDLALKQKNTTNGNTSNNLVDLTAVSLKDKWSTGTGTATAIGEALLVAPGAESYEMELTLSQTVPVKSENDGGTYPTQTKTITVPLAISYPNTNVTDKTFKAGHSYKVAITVYGLEQIKVNATLTQWEEENASIDLDAQ